MPSVNANHTAEDSSAAGPISAATERLIATVTAFEPDDLGMPSRCPGWTRAHVIAHVARNADALVNLLTWAGTGTVSPMYTSAESRAADIEAGAKRDLTELLEDLIESAGRFTAAVSAMPGEAWQHEVRLGPGAGGRPIPARRVLWQRLKEVEIHHVDLDAGYGPDDWSPAFVERALAESVRMFNKREDSPAVNLIVDGAPMSIGAGAETTVTGPAPHVLAWLTGRSRGADLAVEPAPIPALPPWA